MKEIKLAVTILFLLFISSCAYPWFGIPMVGLERRYPWVGGVRMLFVFLVLIGIIIYLALSNRRRIEENSVESPLDILKKRYAKGEITKKKFEKMKKELEEQ